MLDWRPRSFSERTEKKGLVMLLEGYQTRRKQTLTLPTELQ